VTQRDTSGTLPRFRPARVPTFPDAGMASGANTNLRIKGSTHFLKLTIKLRRPGPTPDHARNRCVLGAFGIRIHSSLKSKEFLLVSNSAQSRGFFLGETSVQYDGPSTELQQTLLFLAV
jgi:hypothetical protein